MARTSAKHPKPRVYVTHSDSIVDSQLVTLARMRAAAKKFPGLMSRVDIVHGDGPAAVEASLPETDILLLSGNIDFARLRERAPHLRWIQSCSAGVEKLAPMIPDGIALTNASGVHGPRGGEYGMTAILMLNSRVPAFVTNQQRARWEQIHTTPLKGKTLVLLGVGAIGSEVARLAKRFGMRVLGVTRGGKPHKSVDRMVRTKQLAQVLPKADFVLSTLPLTPETDGLVGRAELDLLPRHAGVVNLGRGRVMDYDALRDKLQKGELSGAVLDVFYEEPTAAASPLWSTPNLIMSPHCAVDDESVYVERCLDIFFDNLKRFLAGRPLENVVNTKLGY
ncbi:MAG TPA: D-2-hydroxyacid dehydrogenase [Stellaceae bacterium]|nr:D-2-hydroxyacid dehydrogenase [Stellaceae bacterium]